MGVSAKVCCRGDPSAGRLSSRANRLGARSCIRLDTEMVGELFPGEAACKTLRIERQHGRVPFFPLRDQPVIDVPMPILKVGTLHGILDNVEEEGVAEDFQILPVAIARRLLVAVFIPPKQLTWPRRRC